MLRLPLVAVLALAVALVVPRGSLAAQQDTVPRGSPSTTLPTSSPTSPPPRVDSLPPRPPLPPLPHLGQCGNSRRQ